jgi:V8-like Glu-specific endopeptidase
LRVAVTAGPVIAAVLIAVRLSFPGAALSDQAGRKSPPPAIGAQAKVARMANSIAFEGTSAVGALFTKNGSNLGSHFCSASVVHSPKGNLLITAAHCMSGQSLQAPNGVVFAPGYHDGQFPLGVWNVTAVYVTANWNAQQDPNDDVAFLTVATSGKTIEQVAGAEQLGDFTTLPTQAEVIGYPDTTEQPVACTAPAVPYQVGGLRQMEFTCNGYTTGTSGGPFLINVNPATGEGQIIGVIGGYEQGGVTPMVTYSSEFLDNVAALYKLATSG